MSRIPFYLKERIEKIKKRYAQERLYRRTLPKSEKIILMWIVILICWLIVSGDLSWQSFIVGGSVSLIISTFMYENLTDDLRCEDCTLPRKIFNLSCVHLPKYVFIMLFQLIEANFRVAKHALFFDINPGIVRIETDLRSNTGITLLANSITLTPGTLTIDVDKKMDKTYLYVHWIFLRTLNMEKAGDEIKGDVERWLARIFW
jgi:multicomponent Na+:H+ antiporter subunit E